MKEGLTFSTARGSPFIRRAHLLCYVKVLEIFTCIPRAVLMVISVFQPVFCFQRFVMFHAVQRKWGPPTTPTPSSSLFSDSPFQSPAVCFSLPPFSPRAASFQHSDTGNEALCPQSKGLAWQGPGEAPCISVADWNGLLVDVLPVDLRFEHSCILDLQKIRWNCALIEFGHFSSQQLIKTWFQKRKDVGVLYGINCTHTVWMQSMNESYRKQQEEKQMRNHRI